jgi:hypothetical protein
MRICASKKGVGTSTMSLETTKARLLVIAFNPMRLCICGAGLALPSYKFNGSFPATARTSPDAYKVQYSSLLGVPKVQQDRDQPDL